MNTRPPDDIGALCTHAGIRREVYRVFTGPPRRPVQAAPPSQAPPAAPPRREAPSSGAARRTNLHAALERALLSARAETATSRRPATLQLLTCGGGAGSTSLLASLARAFSVAGERVAVVDQSPASAVPLYFGARALRGGHCTFFPERDSQAGPVHLIAREEGEAGGEWLSRGLAHLEGELDRVLVDGPGAEFPGTGGGVRLLLAVPDLAAIMRAHHLAEGAAQPPYLLLNKFDAAAPLHREIRGMLAAQSGLNLLPFEVRRSDQFAEALAEGATVLEYAPRGAAAEDVLRVAEWLRKVCR